MNDEFECRLLARRFLQQVNKIERACFHVMHDSVNHGVQNAVSDEGENADNQTTRRREHFDVNTARNRRN